MLRLISEATTIPGGYSYVHPTTGVSFGPCHNVSDLTALVWEHEKAMELARTSRDAIVHQICLRSPEECLPDGSENVLNSLYAAETSWLLPILQPSQSESLPADLPPAAIQGAPVAANTGQAAHPSAHPGLPKLRPLDFASALKATRLLSRWVLGGRKRVQPFRAAERARICLSCPFHAAVQGCASCNVGVLRNLVEQLVGVATFPGYDELQGCQICGCSLKAKVQIPADFFALEPGLPDSCWIVQETAPTRN